VHIADVVTVKGAAVATTRPDATIAELVADMVRREVGALVVTDDRAVVGIVSERDVVRALDAHGPAVMNLPVGQIMTREVLTSFPGTSLEPVIDAMTQRHVRHLPVVCDGKLRGIVSLSEVDSNRIGELETENEWLHVYISS
jgi:CBS domain-containing protein